MAKQSQQNASERLKINKRENWKFIIIIILTLITIAFAYRQTYISEKSMKFSNQAYLSIGKPFPFARGAGYVKFILKNIGQSPAYSIKGSHGFAVLKHLNNTPEFIERNIAPTLGKGSTITFQINWPRSVGVTQDTWDSLDSGDSLLVFTTRYTYFNIFDEKCTFKSCFIWVGGQWQICNKHETNNCD